mmetsp:Transcript_39155/g.117724  ORF Transcript_39155/g.117724 Transcript_39155/m.117724 type:complete len:205 (-) Transcript_39155:125-739(-)
MQSHTALAIIPSSERKTILLGSLHPSSMSSGVGSANRTCDGTSGVDSSTKPKMTRKRWGMDMPYERCRSREASSGPSFTSSRRTNSANRSRSSVSGFQRTSPGSRWLKVSPTGTISTRTSLAPAPSPPAASFCCASYLWLLVKTTLNAHLTRSSAASARSDRTRRISGSSSNRSAAPNASSCRSCKWTNAFAIAGRRDRSISSM